MAGAAPPSPCAATSSPAIPHFREKGASTCSIPLTYTGVGWQSHFIDKVVYEMARAQGLPFPTQAWDYYEMARATLAGYPSGCQRTP